MHLHKLSTRLFTGKSPLLFPFHVLSSEGGVWWFPFACYQIGLEKPNVSIQLELDLAQGIVPRATFRGCCFLWSSSWPLSECFSEIQKQKMEDINTSLKFILKHAFVFCLSSKEQSIKKLGPCNDRNLIYICKNLSSKLDWIWDNSESGFLEVIHCFLCHAYENTVNGFFYYIRNMGPHPHNLENLSQASTQSCTLADFRWEPKSQSCWLSIQGWFLIWCTEGLPGTMSLNK